MFRCPVCLGELDVDSGDRAWRCGLGHHFDVAREGYANLLVTHQRRRRRPGDSPEMLRHRRAFLDAGHFEPLARALRRWAGPGLAVLDAGCGEGYYTRDWPDLHPGLRLWAVDIAKDGVRMAASRARPGSRYAVGSVYDLPLCDASVDVVLSVFAPLASQEFERVLRPGGLVVTVSPGPRHLAGLKERLFEEPGTHPGVAPFSGPGATTALVEVEVARLGYGLRLDGEAEAAGLVGMTPYAWYVGSDLRRAAATPPLATPVDFVVSVYRRPAGPG